MNLHQKFFKTHFFPPKERLLFLKEFLVPLLLHGITQKIDINDPKELDNLDYEFPRGQKDRTPEEMRRKFWSFVYDEYNPF